MSTGRRSAEKLPTDLAAANQWLAEHGDALYRYARARIAGRELAEDLVQETFLAAVESHPVYRGEASVRTWLISILRRKIVDHYRSLPRTAPAETSPDAAGNPTRRFTPDGRWQEVPAEWPTDGEQLERQEFWLVLERCLAKLPVSLARAFRLRELMGLEMVEICESQQLTAANVRVRLHRARLLLRDCLERNWFGEAINKPSREP